MGFDRSPLGEGGQVLVATGLAELGVLAAFTERTGGVSREPFATLNASLAVGDDPSAVGANRRVVIAGLDVPAFAIAGLVHGSTITRVGPKRAGAGFDAREEALPATDALATASPRIPLAVTTADCVPLVYASLREPTVVVAHAGWRGFAAGIVEAALSVYEVRSSVRVAIGPAIGPCHYEVGSDVALAVAAGAQAGAVTETDGAVLRLDLVGTARRILEAADVDRVDDTGLCTACESERFFSHRRDGTTGRQLAIGMRR